MSHGVQTVARKGYGFLLDDECNFCTLKKIRDANGDPRILLCRNKKGVEVIVNGLPLLWFDVVPERCVCNL